MNPDEMKQNPPLVGPPETEGPPRESLREQIQQIAPHTPASVLARPPKNLTSSQLSDNAELWDQATKLFQVIISRVEQLARTLDSEWQAVRSVMLDVEVTARLMQAMIGDFDQLQQDQREQTQRLGLVVAAAARVTQTLQEIVDQQPTLLNQ